MPAFTVPLHEHNDCHNPAGAGGGQFCSGPPAAAGTTPLPAGHIRAYHYTTALDAVLQSGLSTRHARGATYGEPNVIWFSTQKPGDFKNYVEVHLRPEELGIGRISNRNPTQEEIDRFNAQGGNFTALAPEIPASRIVTHHRPWHAKYYVLMEEYPPEALTTKRWKFKLEKAGYTSVEDIVQSFEKIGGDEYGPAVKAWAAQVRKAQSKR